MSVNLLSISIKFGYLFINSSFEEYVYDEAELLLEISSFFFFE